MSQSGIPKVEGGVYTASVSRDIDAPIGKVWEVLTNFPAYEEWNPFVRSMVITDASRNVDADQAPGEGKHLLMKVHIPPTMEAGKSQQAAFEIITVVDADGHRLAWRNIDYPRALLQAERWQVLTELADGKTRYESQETFAGPLAYALKWFISKNLMLSFNAMADALKGRSERA